MGDLLKIAGLWKSKSGSGYSGTCQQDDYTREALALVQSGNPFRFVLLKNNRKQGNQPDLNLFVAPTQD